MTDKKTALDNFENHFSITADEDEAIRLSLPQFIIYRKSGVRYDCYCTACKSCFPMTPQCHGINSIIMHNADSKCPECHKEGKFLSGGKVPARQYYHQQNFVIFRAINNELYISCMTAKQRFVMSSDDWNGISDYDVDFSLYEKHRYVCGKDGAMHFSFCGKWEQVKNLNEPCFHTGSFFYPDNSYTTVSETEICKTCMKYCGYEKFIEDADNFDKPYFITFLCTLAKYPALEKLMKCGFQRLVYDYIGSHQKKILNIRSTDPKKILRLSTPEMKILSGCDRETYEHWLCFRNFRISGDIWHKAELFERYESATYTIDSIITITGLSAEKVMNYIDKQRQKRNTVSITARDWNDYLAQCRRLCYDLTDTAVSKPKDLYKAHEKVTKLIKEQGDILIRNEFLDRMQSREFLEFADNDLIVIQPQCFDEIIEEGKALCHCVGGYAERHARGELSIMFLRKADEPSKPFYTIEVDEKGTIIQCRGYKNNIIARGGSQKPTEILEFEKKYQQYLNQITKTKKARKTA